MTCLCKFKASILLKTSEPEGSFSMEDKESLGHNYVTLHDLWCPFVGKICA